jgi:hypothetical protein
MLSTFENDCSTLSQYGRQPEPTPFLIAHTRGGRDGRVQSEIKSRQPPPMAETEEVWLVMGGVNYAETAPLTRGDSSDTVLAMTKDGFHVAIKVRVRSHPSEARPRPTRSLAKPV